MTTSLQILGLPRYLTELCLSYSDPLDLLQIYNINTKFRCFFHRTNLWQRRLQKDFPGDYSALESYNWCKLYFWFAKKNKLQQKILFTTSLFKFPADRYTILFSSGLPNFIEIISNLFQLGAQIGSIQHLGELYPKTFIYLTGYYKDKYMFTIDNWFDPHIINISINLNPSDNMYSIIVNDIATFVLMTSLPNDI